MIGARAYAQDAYDEEDVEEEPEIPIKQTKSKRKSRGGSDSSVEIVNSPGTSQEKGKAVAKSKETVESDEEEGADEVSFVVEHSC